VLSEKDRHIAEILATRLRERYPEAEVWVFGSRVRGDADPESDLDVCVILERWSEEADKEICHVAWEIGFDEGMVISTVVFSREEFERGPCSVGPFVRAVREEGVSV